MSNNKSFAIISPSPIEGSGGVARIFNFAAALAQSGYDTDVYVFDCGSKSAEEIKKQAKNYYGAKGFNIICSSTLTRKYNFLMATRWDTALIVRDSVADHKLYLVQDFEVTFNSVGDASILAENSYLYGLQPITYGRWLALKLRIEYGCNPYFLEFSSNMDNFCVATPYAERGKNKLSICFIYQEDKPRRCPKLGIEALGIVKHMRPDIEIHLVGSKTEPKLWYDFKNEGLLDLKGLNKLYNKCHLGLCLSSTNPSCNPFDMMAAGLPSVELYRENNLYDLPDEGVMLAHQTPESIAEAIISLIDNHTKREKMSNFGVEFMKNRSAENEIFSFLEIIKKIEEGGSIANFALQSDNKKYSQKAVVASATYNKSIESHVCHQDRSFELGTTISKNEFEINRVQSFGIIKDFKYHRANIINRSCIKRVFSRISAWWKSKL